jgi:hypothetical protein
MSKLSMCRKMVREKSRNNNRRMILPHLQTRKRMKVIRKLIMKKRIGQVAIVVEMTLRNLIKTLTLRTMTSRILNQKMKVRKKRKTKTTPVIPNLPPPSKKMRRIKKKNKMILMKNKQRKNRQRCP